MDSRDKRASALSLSLPFRLVAPLPNSEIGSQDRLILLYRYSGFEALGVTLGPGKFTVGMVYLPGFKAGQSYLPGFKAGLEYLPGARKGQEF